MKKRRDVQQVPIKSPSLKQIFIPKSSKKWFQPQKSITELLLKAVLIARKKLSIHDFEAMSKAFFGKFSLR